MTAAEIKARANVPHSGNVTRTTLENGITVLVYETPHTQSVVLSGSLDSGAVYEDQATKGGLASMVASSLMRGTTTRDFDTLHSTLEDIGADLSVGSGMHRAGFNGKALAEDLPILVDVLADVLRNPALPDDQVERLRGERLTSLNYLQQDTQWNAGTRFRKMLYPADHPYHFSTRGTLTTLPTISLDEMRAFHAQHYGPQGMVLTVVGNVKAADVLDIVQGALGDWTQAEKPARYTLPTIDARPNPQMETIHLPEKTQADIIMGVLGPSRFSDDYQAANLGNSILGVFGMMGRIGAVVREREGLAYYAGSRLDGGFGPGAWRVSAGVSPENIERAIDLCKDEIRRFIETPVSTQDLEDNKSYFIGRLPLQLESNDGLAATLHSMESYGLGLDYLATYAQTITAITAEHILEAARRYLDPETLVISVAGTV